MLQGSWNNSQTLSWKTKRHYIFPNRWLVHVQRFHRALLHFPGAVPCSYLRRCRIQRRVPQSKALLLWLLLSYCFVTVGAAGERGEARRCVQTWNSNTLTLQKSRKTCTSSAGGRGISAGGKKTVKTNTSVCGPASRLWKNMSKLWVRKM